MEGVEMTKHGNLGIQGKCLGPSCADDWVIDLVAAEESICPGEIFRGSCHRDVNPES